MDDLERQELMSMIKRWRDDADDLNSLFEYKAADVLYTASDELEYEIQSGVFK